MWTDAVLKLAAGIAPGADSGYVAWQARYRDRPDLFAAECVRWPRGKGLAGYQTGIMADLVTAKRLAVRSPHGAGKTTTAALIVLWFALTRDGWADWKVATTASAWRHLSKYLWPEIAKWARRLDWAAVGRPALVDGRELLQMSIKLTTGEAFAVASNQPWAIEGAHAQQLLYVFDEAKEIPPETWDAVEGAFMTAGSDTGDEGFTLAISTPGLTRGRFYDIHRRAPGYEDWTVRRVTLDEAIAAGRVSREKAEQRARQWGTNSAVYQNRVMGEFTDEDKTGVIPFAWVEAAVGRWQDRGNVGPLTCVALDVADGGADRSIMARRHGNVLLSLDDVTQPEHGMTMALAGVVNGALTGGGYAVVDSVGVGAGVVSRLRELGRTVVPFGAGEGTTARDASGEMGFVNVRSAAWWGLRERLHPETGDGLALPDDDDLIGDLTEPRWTTTSSGKIAVESKDALRKPDRLARSTDRGDACIMAFWEDRKPEGIEPSWDPRAEHTMAGSLKDLDW